jgi:pyrroline-5-carboxylate reductase
MLASGRLSIIGGGRMGEAIVAGLVASGTVAPSAIVVAEPDSRRRDTLHAAHGVDCVAGAAEAVSGADTVILAVKPQVMEDVVASMADAIPPLAVVVSIAAGLTSARIASWLAPGTAVVRVMPNTPAMAREGMSIVCKGPGAGDEQVRAVRELFGALGRALILDERHIDAATAISGSGPAYVALFIDALARAGVRHGLTREVAEELAVQTVKGTAVLLEATGQHPEQLIDGVSSPGGTTIAAVERLEALGLRAAVAEAVSAAVARAEELGA